MPSRPLALNHRWAHPSAEAQAKLGLSISPERSPFTVLHKPSQTFVWVGAIVGEVIRDSRDDGLVAKQSSGGVFHVPETWLEERDDLNRTLTFEANLIRCVSRRRVFFEEFFLEANNVYESTKKKYHAGTLTRSLLDLLDLVLPELRLREVAAEQPVRSAERVLPREVVRILSLEVKHQV